jgi:tetratricopeptide (TPR) repeat protein
MGPAALALAVGQSGTLDPRAAAFLEKQGRLADLQIENLKAQDEYEVSHLRWRRFNDQMRGALQMVMLALGLLVVAGISAILWNAHEARGLVIQPLKTPPDFGARGLDGTVLAQRLLDKLNGLVAESEPASYRSADSIAGNWGDDSKVEIPDTGVSIGELSRTLRDWLGSETHASGEIWRSASGITVAVRASGNVGITTTGPEEKLDQLLDRAAESLLAQTQPYRYAAVLNQRGRYKDTLAFVMPIAQNSAVSDRAWAYTFWANTLSIMGRNHEALAPLAKGERLDPSDPSNYFIQGGIDVFHGRDQDGMETTNLIRNALSGVNSRLISATAIAAIKPLEEEAVCRLAGDFVCAAQKASIMRSIPFVGYEYSDLLGATLLARAHDGDAARALLAQHPDWNDVTSVYASAFSDVSLPNYFLAINKEDWRSAIADASAADRATSSSSLTRDFRHTFLWSWISYALAKGGDTSTAKGLIALTPLDCDLCVEMRGRIAAIAGDWRAADFWFGRSEKQAPSLPFSLTDWGQMLLGRGDFDGAISKFSLAHDRGPHFADPLEMWGEALMEKNRSDLALAKFEEAYKYAPNWGRLHLKWGEALWWCGQKDAARKQFAAAGGLDMGPADRAALASWLKR